MLWYALICLSNGACSGSCSVYTGTDCGDGDDRYSGVCDKDSCDFNSYRMGDKTFLGAGKTIDTSKKITVVTQFITDDGTASGALSEIRRLYIQDGKVYSNSQSLVSGVTGNSLSDSFCAAQKTTFGDTSSFATKGGMDKMGQSLDNGMVLALSLWDDYAVNMLWLDSNYPTDKDASAPGVSRGPCATTSGAPADVEAQSPGATVTYSNIKFGDIDTTYSGTTAGEYLYPSSLICPGVNPAPPGSSSSVLAPVSSSTTKPSTSTSVSSESTFTSATITTVLTTTTKPVMSTSAPETSSAAPAPTQTSGTVAQWGQCGGVGYTGATACVAPYTCHEIHSCTSSFPLMSNLRLT